MGARSDGPGTTRRHSLCVLVTDTAWSSVPQHTLWATVSRHRVSGSATRTRGWSCQLQWQAGLDPTAGWGRAGLKGTADLGGTVAHRHQPHARLPRQSGVH